VNEVGSTDLEIAIIGWDGRFPGADSVEALWALLCAGRAAPVRDGVAWLEQVDRFDAPLFQMSPREAALMDPQHRLLLEGARAALEDAGHPWHSDPRPVGVFVSASPSTYLLWHLLAGGMPEQLGSTELLGVGVDYLATRIAFKLGLQGPAVAVQSACSSSLLAVHQAMGALLAGDCDLALAGGVSVRFPRDRSVHGEGIVSPTGICRAFDAGADGTIAGEGAAVVVLKRMADALQDGDDIRAVICGSAVNNDGAQKVGFSAPRPAGQAQVVRQALASAGLGPEDLDYVEAHGTGTALGDPVEIGALAVALAGRQEPCLVGSIKPTIGHLDAASGVAGLIKAALAVQRGFLPQSLHFRTPNPACGFDRAPLAVVARGQDWPATGRPRRAGVSSFGIGGTNVHLIVQQPPSPPPRPAPGPEPHLLMWSAATDAGAAQLARLLADRLEAPELRLDDVTATLQRRRPERVRRALVASSLEEARVGLRDPARWLAAESEGEPALVWFFPGQGAQTPGMAAVACRELPAFRAALERCLELLPLPELRSALLDPDFAPARAAETALCQAALFATEVALAETLLGRGLVPQIVVGHSVGEIAAAYVAGALSLEEAASLVLARGQAMERCPRGGMLAVQADPHELPPLPRGVGLAAHNAPGRSMVAGALEALAQLEVDLPQLRRLAVSHAFHTPAMRPAAQAIAQLPLQGSVPAVRWLSSVDGAEMGAPSADYFARQLVQPVRFVDALRALPPRVALLEVGPGRALCGFAARTLPAAQIAGSATPLAPAGARAVSEALGKLWCAGVPAGPCEGRPVPLPTYPFADHRYLVEAQPSASPGQLRLVVQERAEQPRGTVELDDPVERAVAHAFAEVTGRGVGSRESDLFELGGDSLAGAQVVARLRQALSREIRLRDLLGAPTVRAFAQRLKEAPPLSEAALPPPPNPRPLSPAERRLWLFDRVDGASVLNLPLVTRLRRPVDAKALERALQALVRRHDVLRTGYLATEDGPVAVVHEHVPVGLQVVEMGSLPEDRRQAQVQALVVRELQRPFPRLDVPPLLRVNLVALGPEDFVLVLIVHHLVTDGWSNTLLARDLLSLYQSEEGPPPPTSYAAFAAHLAGEPVQPPLPLPDEASCAQILLPAPDRPAPPGPVRLERRLPVSVLDGLCAELGVTRYSALLATWQAVLGRRVRRERFFVASPVSRRPRADLHGVVGCFVSLLPQLAQLQGDPSARELAQRVHRHHTELLDASPSSIEGMLAELRRRAPVGAGPLFQVLFSLQNQPALDLDAVGGASPLSLALPAQHELDLLVRPAGAALEVELLVRAERVELSWAQGLLDEWLALVQAAAREPDRPLSELQVLSPELRERVLAQSTGAALPEGSVLQAIAARARELPERPALLWRGEILSYRALWAAATATAAQIRPLLDGPERAVLLDTRRGLPVAVGLLAGLLAGAVVVPVDPSWPEARLDEIRRAVDPVGALSGDPEVARRLAPGRTVLEILPGPAVSLPLPEARSAAYVLFTSGTTGQPKGVVVEHGALAATLLHRVIGLPVCPEDRVLHTIPFTFDPSLWQLLGPWMAGASVSLAPEQADLGALLEADPAVSITDVVPSQLEVLLAAGKGTVLQRLKCLYCGGEALPPDLLERLLQAQPASVFNQYGPTEAAIDATAWRAVPRTDGLVPIGVPVSNKLVRVLGPHLELLGPGVVGELYVGGALARGYHGAPALTAASFVPDPHGTPGARLYRTGDLARWLPDGTLKFEGRVDRQLKVRGRRLEPEPIEATLRRYPGVRAAVVDSAGQGAARQLVAWVEGEVSDKALRAWLAEQLPAHAVPDRVVVCEALPRLPSGKLDLRALPLPGRPSEGTLVGPAQLVASIWSRVLGCEVRSEDDDFFLLGGQSLLAAQVTARIERQLGVQIPLRTLFAFPRLGDYARQVAGGRPLQSAPLAPSGATEAPLTPAQAWVLRDARLASLPSASALRVHGALEPERLQRALDQLLALHAGLRTSFAGGSQRLGEGHSELSLHDLRGRPEEVSQALLAELATRPIEPAAPVVRLGVLQIAEQVHDLVLAVARPAVDAASVRQIWRDLLALYEGEQPQASTLTPLDLAGSDGTDLGWWAERLDGVPDLQLPGPVAPGEGVCVVTVALGRAPAGTTPFAWWLATFQAALARGTGQHSFAVAVPMDDRDRAELEGMVVRAVALRPIPARLTDRPSLGALAERAQHALVGALSHRAAGTGEVLDQWLGRAPSVAFNLPGHEAALSVGREVQVLAVPPAAEFALEVHMSELDGLARAELRWRADRVDLPWVESLQTAWSELCRAPADTPALPRPARLPRGAPVVVVGAGPVGCLTALLLQQAGWPVEVVEQGPGHPYRRVSDGKSSVNLTLSTRGVAALRRAGLADQVQALSREVSGRCVHKADQIVHTLPYGPHGEALWSVSRRDLTSLLFDATVSAGIPVHLLQACESVDPATGELGLRERDSGRTHRKDARIVVGADGVNSVVRTTLQRTSRLDFEQRYFSVAYKELVVDPPQDARFQRDVLHFWPRVGRMLIGFPNRDGTLTLTLHMPLEGPESFASHGDPDALAQLFSASFPDVWPIPGPLWEEFALRPPNALVTVRCRPWWRGQVVLVGDAAHAIVPYYGQGVNGGFQDAVTLVQELVDHPDDPRQAFARYEQQRSAGADVISRLAEHHYAELQDGLKDDTFLVRMVAENRLHALCAERYVPLYYRIAFTEQDYARALESHERQVPLLQRLLAEPDLARSVHDHSLDRVIWRVLDSNSGETT
jgi:amino acid adenylation domain-containing protein